MDRFWAVIVVSHWRWLKQIWLSVTLLTLLMWFKQGIKQCNLQIGTKSALAYTPKQQASRLMIGEWGKEHPRLQNALASNSIVLTNIEPRNMCVGHTTPHTVKQWCIFWNKAWEKFTLNKAGQKQKAIESKTQDYYYPSPSYSAIQVNIRYLDEWPWNNLQDFQKP